MKSWVLWASLATLLSVGFCQKQTLPIKVLRCFECNANSNAGVTANCHLDPSNPGTKMTCQNDQVCFKEILGNFWKIRIFAPKTVTINDTFCLFQKRLTETWCTHADASNLLLISKKVRIAQNKRAPTGKMSPNAFVLRANATAFHKLCLWWHQWLLHWLSWKLFIRRQFFETIYSLLETASNFSENKTKYVEMHHLLISFKKDLQ